MGVYVPQSVCGGQRTTCQSHIISSTIWVPGIELRSYIYDLKLAVCCVDQAGLKHSTCCVDQADLELAVCCVDQGDLELAVCFALPCYLCLLCAKNTGLNIYA